MKPAIAIVIAVVSVGLASTEVPLRLQSVLTGGRTTLDRFDHPEGVAVDQATGDVYVADAGNGRLLVFDTNGGFRTEIRLFDALPRPSSVAVDASGIYVSGGDPRRLAVLDVRGRFREHLTVDPQDGKGVNVGKIALAGDRLYVADRASNRVLAFHLATRRILLAFGGSGAEQDLVAGLAGIAAGPDGNVYAVDMRRAGVLVFDTAGRVVRKVGEAGGSFGQLAMPTDVAVDRSGRTFVIDATRHTLLVYDGTGRFLREFGGLGKSPGWFYFPRAVSADGFGRVYVTEPFLNRVQVFSTGP